MTSTSQKCSHKNKDGSACDVYADYPIIARATGDFCILHAPESKDILLENDRETRLVWYNGKTRQEIKYGDPIKLVTINRLSLDYLAGIACTAVSDLGGRWDDYLTIITMDDAEDDIKSGSKTPGLLHNADGVAPWSEMEGKHKWTIVWAPGGASDLETWSLDNGEFVSGFLFGLKFMDKLIVTDWSRGLQELRYNGQTVDLRWEGSEDLDGVTYADIVVINNVRKRVATDMSTYLSSHFDYLLIKKDNVEKKSS